MLCRKTFVAVGKFQEQMILEDLELVYTVRQNGGTIVTLPASVHSSSRRWVINGVIGNTLRNQFVLIGRVCTTNDWLKYLCCHKGKSNVQSEEFGTLTC